MMLNTTTDAEMSTDSNRTPCRSSSSDMASTESSRSSVETSAESSSGFAGEDIDVLASNPGKKISLSGYWESDDATMSCHKCKRKFSLFRRRHHCRICGSIFCSSCCFVRYANRGREQTGQDSISGFRTCKSCYERKVPSRFSVRHLVSDSFACKESPRSESDIRRELRPLLSYDSNRFAWTETMQYGIKPCPVDNLNFISKLVVIDRIDHLLPQSALRLIDTAPHRIQFQHTDAVNVMGRFMQRQLKAIRERACHLLHDIEGPDFAIRFVDIVTSLSRQAAYLLRDTSLRSHLSLISTCANSPADSFLVRGIVLRKNVVHRRMTKRILSPTIALIDFPIGLYEDGDVLLSLRRVRSQERSMIRRLASRILQLEPDIVVSSTVVPRLAQDIFRHHDVAVVIQVDHQTLQQLSRSTGATIITREMIEQQMEDDPLGRCGKFQVETMTTSDRSGEDTESSPLMMFSDCPEEQAITIVLRGDAMCNVERISDTVQDLAAIAHLQITFASLMNNYCGEYVEGSDEDHGLSLRIRLKSVATEPKSIPEFCSVQLFTEDLSLQQFLQDCFNAFNIACGPSCVSIGQPFDHIQVFVRNERQIRFKVERLPQNLVAGSHRLARAAKRIATWTKCKACDCRTSPISLLSKGAERILMQDFLRPWLSANQSISYNPLCKHRLFSDHTWFMAQNDVTVSISSSQCLAYDLHCFWVVLGEDARQHRQLIQSQALSLTHSINTLLSFLTETISHLDVDCTTREAMADAVLIRTSWFRRKIARFENRHALSPHYISEFARLELQKKIFFWTAGSLFANNVTVSSESLFVNNGNASSDAAKSALSKPIGFRTIPYRSRSTKRRRSIAAVRSRSVDSIGEPKIVKATRASHCHDFFVKSLVSIINACMDSEPSHYDVIVPIIPDDLSSHIAHMLASKAHIAFCTAESSASESSIEEGSRQSATSRDDGDSHFQNDVFVASIDTKINFKAAFARQFRQLRQQLYKLSDKQYIASLTSSTAWNEHGGKSRARFFMSNDKRLILKSLTERQYKIFMANAIPYLTYMHQQKGETCLVPILGIYRLEYSKTTPASISNLLFCRMRHEVDICIVIPNILYGMDVSAEFDLKGARMSSGFRTAGCQENRLFTFTNGMPFALRRQQLGPFIQQLEQDTDFLVQQQNPGSIDYSILVGVDQENQRLAIGVIDYISQYTLERKLESRLKTAQASLFGLQSPTVISPVEYRERLLKAIQRYFIEVD